MCMYMSMYMYMYIIHILYMYNVHAHSMCTIYLFTLHQIMLGHVKVKLDVETLHKLSDGVSIGIGLLWSGKYTVHMHVHVAMHMHTTILYIWKLLLLKYFSSCPRLQKLILRNIFNCE